MARIIGIDIRDTHVRAALLRTRFRVVELERLSEVQVTSGVEAALAEALKPMLHLGEHLAVAIDGQRAFVHTLKIPSTALRQLGDVLPFELEAEIPIDIDEVVYDYRLPKGRASGPVMDVLTAAAREADVRAAIQLVKGVTRREPERVSLGALPLANLGSLAPAALTTRPVALIDFGGAHTDFVVVDQGQVVFARTLSQGVGVLPAGAESLAAELRQSLTAWLAKGGQGVEVVYLTGSLARGAAEYLAYHLSTPVEVLPPLDLKLADTAQGADVPRFARAIGIALGLRSGAQDLNLRQGGGGFQSSFGALRERAPVLSGLVASIFVFFLFSSWAELRALDRDHEALEAALSKLSLHVLGEETTDPERVSELLDKGPGKQDSDPMPRFDAFDVIVEISKAVPHTVTHDIEDFDVQRSKVKMNGVVGSTDEAQNIATKLKEHSCLHDVKVSKFTQVVNSERQKYVLEFDALCPEDGGGKKAVAKADPSGGGK
ncbi:MAG: pilus assembly protein PilM [Polyangiaceae bacterium]|nr:pilus assembly protein PilM [Polyangiaceae bacterium]MCW5791915.1 pilus assembly protein PilM [Polyangiaceae bacterium]